MGAIPTTWYLCKTDEERYKFRIAQAAYFLFTHRKADGREHEEGGAERDWLNAEWQRKSGTWDSTCWKIRDAWNRTLKAWPTDQTKIPQGDDLSRLQAVLQARFPEFDFPAALSQAQTLVGLLELLLTQARTKNTDTSAPAAGA